MFRSLKYQYPSILWLILVLLLCNMPVNDLPGDDFKFFDGFDKLVHTGLFFVLTVLFFFGSIREHSSISLRFITIAKIVFLSFSLGAVVELLQWKVFTYRSGDWWDFFCDTVGVGMAVFSYLILCRARISN